MANFAVLNIVDHKDLRVDTGHGAALGDDVMCALAIPSEFRNLVGDYPIFLHRDHDSGKLLPMAMFGFQEGENLFLDGDQWDACYIPLLMQRGPFLIGFQGGEPGSDSERTMVISVDMEHPRVGAEGEALFLSGGETSAYTDKIADILQAIDEGQPHIEEFARVLEEHDLVEPFTFNVRLDNGKQYSLDGFFTVNEEKLAALDAEVLTDLARRGLLYAAHMVLASMSNLPRMVRLKNRRD